MPLASRYDVAAWVRAIYDEVLGSSPNLATPEVLLLVLQRLSEFTSQIETADLKRREELGFGPGSHVGCDRLCQDLARWRARLDWYALEAAAAPPGDRQAVLWTVTAPLLLGWHGGPPGAVGSIMVAPGGYPPGFNFAMPHGADVATPFILANAEGVFVRWEAERRDLLWADMQHNAERLVPEPPLGIPWWLWVLGGFGAWWAFKAAAAPKMVVAAGAVPPL